MSERVRIIIEGRTQERKKETVGDREIDGER